MPKLVAQSRRCVKCIMPILWEKSAAEIMDRILAESRKEQQEFREALFGPDARPL